MSFPAPALTGEGAKPQRSPLPWRGGLSPSGSRPVSFFLTSSRVAPRMNLEVYLERVGPPRMILLGEALGFRGGRFSGIAFTSERQLAGPAERRLPLGGRVHPFGRRAGTRRSGPLTNRTPERSFVAAGHHSWRPLQTCVISRRTLRDGGIGGRRDLRSRVASLPGGGASIPGSGGVGGPDRRGAWLVARGGLSHAAYSYPAHLEAPQLRRL